jgi:peptide deformylase
VYMNTPGVITQIRQMPDPVLTQSTSLVTAFDHNLRGLSSFMIEVMVASGGVGLAANQIGISQNLFVYDAQDGSGPHCVANARIVAASDEEFSEEGCLSIKRGRFLIPRARSITWEGQDMYGGGCGGAATGLEARIIQHESDHLRGKCLLDYVSRQDKLTALGLLGTTKRVRGSGVTA